MKFSLSWIREFVEITNAPAELARMLTSVGLPVETVTAGSGGDAIFDIDILSNRPDCMNIYGVAREVAAATGRGLCPFPGNVEETGSAPAAAKLARVSILNPDLCGRYTARIIQGVSVGPSPDWLAGRLATVGLRPVNNIVDVTNYVLWEFGHPLHAFDLDTLRGHEIRVRRARKGESIQTLDGVQRPLDAEMLVIADAERPVALAGVMGGTATMVTGKTVNLLLESAHFDPVSVRRTSKRLGLSTDASLRFERGADIEATVIALNRVASLIQQVAGGAVCPGVVEARPREAATRRLRLRAARVSALLGIPVAAETIARVLSGLQFVAHLASGVFDVEVPSHRQDIEREIDLIEEVARSLSYESVPERLPHIEGSASINRAGHRREAAIRLALSSAGCSEAVTTSFSSAATDWGLRQRLDPGEPAIEPIVLANPIAADQEILRTTILPGLLMAVAHNINRGVKDVRLYEMGRTFRRGQAPPPSHGERKHAPIGPVEEILSLGVAVTGNMRPEHWLEPPRGATYYDIKGAIASVLSRIGLQPDIEPLPGSEGLDTDRAAVVSSQGRRLGRIGAVSVAWRERLDIRQEVFVAELNLTDLFALPEHATAFHALPRYPWVSRDLSLVVRQDQPYRDLEKTICDVAPDRIARVSVFDRYQGDALPAGTVGLSINIVYQHPDRTLASDEVADLQDRILRSLEGGFGVKLRA